MFEKINGFPDLQAFLETFCSFLKEKEISDEKVFDSKLVLCELVENVLIHTSGFAEVEKGVKDGYIHIKVRSSVPFTAPKTSALVSPTAESGRGLFLVDHLGERSSIGNDTIFVKIKIEE